KLQCLWVFSIIDRSKNACHYGIVVNSCNEFFHVIQLQNRNPRFIAKFFFYLFLRQEIFCDIYEYCIAIALFAIANLSEIKMVELGFAGVPIFSKLLWLC